MPKLQPSVARHVGDTLAATPRQSAGGIRVGVVVDPSTTLGREVAAGAVQYGREAGDWRLVMAESHEAPRPDVDSWDVHGLIASFDDPAFAALVRGRGLPFVVVGRNDPESGACRPRDGRQPRVPYVTGDDETIGMLAAEHLLERGLRAFGFHGIAAAWSEDRRAAFERRVVAAGLPRPSVHVTGDAAQARRGQADLMAWLADLPRPVGIMACDDRRARHVLEACAGGGLCVPDDVAVIGVDNDELTCELADPTLSSVALAGRRVGYEAARALDRLLRPRRFAGGGRRPRRIAIEPTGVVARASTATLAVTDPVVAEVIRTVRERACSGLSIAELVRMTGLSRWVLDDRFKRSVGHSIHEDMIRVKLAEAQRLAAGTDLPLKVVARRSGFRAVSYMTTVFRRHLSITPAKFRRTHQRGAVVE